MLSSSAPNSLYLSLFLFLSYHSPVLSWQVGNRNQCISAPFVPGYNLVGEGFDMVTLRRKGSYVVDVMTYLTPNDTCKLYSSPSLGKRLRKMPVSAVDWRSYSQSHKLLYFVLFFFFYQVGLNLDSFYFSGGVEGKHSNIYNFAKQRSSEDRFSFSTQRLSCSHYSYRVSKKPPLSSEFSKDLADLPSSYNSYTKDEYNQLIAIYGTHYIRQVYLGGRLRRITAARICLSRLNGFTEDEVHSCLSLGFSVGLGKLASSSLGSCTSVVQNRGRSVAFGGGLHQHYTEVEGGSGWLGEFSLTHEDSSGFHNWMSSLKDHPGVVSYSLRPLYELISSESRKAGMKAAIEQYLKDNVVRDSRRTPSCGYSPNLSFNCCPLATRKGTLKVTMNRAWGLAGDHLGPTDSYAKIKYGSIRRTTRMIESNYPRWDSYFNLGTVDTNHDLLVEVWDEDLYYDDLLLKCYLPVESGSHTWTCSNSKSGYEVEFTLTCDRHLTGEKCERYKPSP
ncbi:perforin-1-like [Mugil cephalus]|uniref:perforin-1-like n=1 Tax=Mugil cephalus TaxID=48193 RepID=UPI001FB6FCC8|nr:perforin-1-like [Mugil cephalus]